MLINFYELLVQYKSAENNPNGEGVVEYFRVIADNMLLIVGDPFLRGFILSLKGMIESLTEGDARSVKQALLLSPGSTKGLMAQSS